MTEGSLDTGQAADQRRTAHKRVRGANGYYRKLKKQLMRRPRLRNGRLGTEGDVCSWHCGKGPLTRVEEKGVINNNGQ